MNIASLSQVIATAAWLGAVAFLIVSILRAGRGHPIARSGMIVLIMFAVAVILTSASAGLVFIQPEERGIVISAVAPQGYRTQALEPGLRWIIPFAESVRLYPISRQTYTMSIATSEGAVQGDDSIDGRTKDGQQVKIDASVIYAIDPTKIIQVHIQWQDRYSNEMVRPQTRGAIRDLVSQYNVEEVVSTKRVEMANQIRDVLFQKFSDNGIVLIDFVLRNVTFSEEYAKSVETKQIAEQQAQQARFVVQQKIAEADQVRETAKGAKDAAITQAEGAAQARILQANAEAQALQVIAKVVNENPSILSYNYINKLAPNLQVMILPNNAPFLFPLPTMQPGTPTDLLPTPAPTPTVP